MASSTFSVSKSGATRFRCQPSASEPTPILELLEKIARDGEGRHYFRGGTHSTIPGRADQGDRACAELLRGEQTAPTAAAFAESHLLQSASSDATLPFLEGFVRTKAKPTAEIVLASDSNDPILATWQLGLGRVVAWTSDTGGEWSEEWSSWAEFSNVLTGMVFWASSGAAGSEVGEWRSTPSSEVRTFIWQSIRPTATGISEICSPRAL